MLLRVLLILIGFLAACTGFALVLVGFVFTPAELAASGSERWSMAGFQLLASAILVAFIAAVPVLIGAVIAEWRGIRSWRYYVFAALLFAGIGFLAQYLSELQGAPTIVNLYGFAAFALGGLVAGTLYWLIAGRRAGADRSRGGIAATAVAGSAT